MIKVKLLIGVLALSGLTFSQTNPQGNPPPNNTNARARAAWYRGGNNFGQNNPPGANIFGTMWNSPIYTYTNGIQRTTLLGTTTANIGGTNYNNSGHLGLNNQTPLFHLDINTNNPGGSTFGELLLRCRIADDPNAYISFLNIATTGTRFIPTLMARQSDNPSSALNTIGSITNSQDLSTNQEPITRFFSARFYDPTLPNFGLQRVNVVENRRLFGWYNGIDQLMTMEANGFLGLGTVSPGNRLEINSDFYNPTTGLPLTGTDIVTDMTDNGIAGLGGVNATGFSGLRLTDLTAGSNPYSTNPGKGVLALDENGDVIYVQSNGIGQGLDCWDINGNGIQDANEDTNNDGIWDALDCQGPQGPIGLTGAQGPQGIQGLPGASTGAHNGTSMSTIDPTKVAFGQNVNEPGNPGQLLSNREVPMNNYNIYFTDANATNSSNNRIGIGTTSPNARFHVVVNDQISESLPKALLLDNNQVASNGVAQGLNVNMSGANTLNTGAWLIINGAEVNTGRDTRINGGNTANGIFGRASDAVFSGNGVVGEATSTNIFTVTNTAVKGISRYARTNYGGFFIGEGNINGASSENYGVYAYAGGTGGTNYGIFASATNTANNNYAGYFQGNVNITNGILTVNGTVISSDSIFKTYITAIDSSLQLINQLQPRKYYLDTINFADFGFESDLQMGLIAQEVEQVIPTIVSNHIRPAQYDSLGIEIAPEISYKGVEYEELIPLLIAGVQEQQVQIETVQNGNDSLEQVVTNLNDRLTQLENCLSGILPFLCELSNSEVQNTDEEIQQKLNEVINVELSDRNNIVLNQNVPNPFAERTVISYSIPANVGKAQIHFYNGMGQLINTVEITERGKGEINVYANDLSSGVYTYYLVADGKIVATKRMMKQ